MDNMSFNQTAETLVNGIRSVVSSMLAKASFDKTYRVTVVAKEYLDSKKSGYWVACNGETHYVKSALKLDLGYSLFLTVPRNNWRLAFFVIDENTISQI